MDWTQTGVILTAIALLLGMMTWFFGKIDSDINKLANRLDGHAQRIDQLYQMFVSLLKEKK